MNRVIRLFSIGILSLFLFGIASTQDVLACSGGYSPTIEEKVEQANFIVRGHIITVDDDGSNAIMRVSEYIKGEGAEYILLALYSPTSIVYRATRYSGGGCFLGVTRMRLEDEIIIFLSKDINGSYILAPGNYTFTYNYYRDSEHHPLLPEGITSLDELSLHIQTFTELVIQSPIQDMPYPLIAPLFITTELGSNYLIPIDGSSPVFIEKTEIGYRPLIRQHNLSCWEIGCTAWSVSGLDFFTVSENSNQEIKGIVISIQNSWARWILDNSSIRIEIGENINTELKTNTLYPNSGAWSPNGRLLAFADSDGIYLWDVFTPNSQPELLITTDIKTIQGFSPLGTYLVVGNDANGFTIDLISRNIYPAGVFSPDESSMITYGDFRQIYFRPYAIYEGYEELLPIHEVHWLNNRVWKLVTCEDVTIKETCELVYGGLRGFSPSISGGRMYAHNAVTGSDVTVIDDYQIRISGRGFSDLSAYLDSPIASIEWLPSLFYYDD